MKNNVVMVKHTWSRRHVLLPEVRSRSESPRRDVRDASSCRCLDAGRAVLCKCFGYDWISPSAALARVVRIFWMSLDAVLIELRQDRLVRTSLKIRYVCPHLQMASASSHNFDPEISNGRKQKIASRD